MNKLTLVLFTLLSLTPYGANATGAAMSCQQGKDSATQECDPEKLAQIQAALQAAQKEAAGTGATTTTQLALDQLAAAQLANGNLGTRCGNAIEQCSQACTREKTEAMATVPADVSKYNQAMQSQTECTQGKPQQVKNASDKAQGDMSALAGLLQGILSALTGLKGDEADPCAVSETRTAEMIAKDPTCGGTLDTATDTASTTLVAGDHRQAKGSVVGMDSLAQGQVPQGTPGKAEMSGASAGSGGMGGMFGFGGGSGSGSGSKDKGSGKENGPQLAAASSNFGGGGSKGGGGGSGRLATATTPPYNPKYSTNDSEKMMQAAVEKAMQQRGPASEGNGGGITGAFSLDNFLKIEKRMQSERTQLSEL